MKTITLNDIIVECQLSTYMYLYSSHSTHVVSYRCSLDQLLYLVRSDRLYVINVV